MRKKWFSGLRRWSGVTCIVLALGGGLARAGDTDADLRRLLEQQSKQIEDLKQRIAAEEAVVAPPLTTGLPTISQPGAPTPVAGPGADPIKKIVDNYLKEKDDQKQAEEAAQKAHAEPDRYTVGSALGMTIRWDPENTFPGLIMETANRDFVVHFGGRLQVDDVWWDQSPTSRLANQLGDFADGMFFRRLRIQADGTFWEVCEFNVEPQFEQVREGIIQMEETYVGITQMPYVGSLRAGHLRVPQGLEGDSFSGSRANTFLERSAAADAFYQQFAPGVMASNSILDQRMTWQGMLYRQESAIHDFNGADFGDGKFGATGRMTCLPLYEDDGRYLVHLGVSASWRKAENPDATGALTTGATAGALTDPAATSSLVGPGVVRFRARPEQRDATGDYGGDIMGSNGLVTDLPGNTIRMVDTGNIAANASTAIGTEFLAILGPLSVQAEWTLASVLGAQVNLNPFNAAIPAAPLQHVGNLNFNGGYAQVSYFLTGENRLYDRRFGKLNSLYILHPNTNFWFVEGDNSRWSLGRGAWEVAARYSYLNLNDGPVQGGVMGAVTLGLNWYLNANLKIQFQYIHDARWDRENGTPNNPVNGGLGAAPGNLSDAVDGFGIRTTVVW